MKRATLTTYSTSSPSVPADMTDRLLEREGDHVASLPAAGRPRRPGASRAVRKADSATLNSAPPEPSPAPAASGLNTALAAAEFAAAALRQAAGEAPARYDVALRYRLDALAHHLQQVKEFVTSLPAR